MHFSRRMDCTARQRPTPGLAAAVLLSFLLPSFSEARGQNFLGFSSKFELSDSVQLDEADAATKSHLERVKAFLENEQWDEAVETLRQVAENHAGKVVAVTPRRYISVREFCHMQIASLPAEALELYRSRVDPQAQRWYERGLAERDMSLLINVVEQAFCSSWGDEALLVLGEVALEQADFGHARGYWEKILPPAYWARFSPPAGQTDGPPPRLMYPDTQLNLADVQARLTLTLILEGDRELARMSLNAFNLEYGAAEGFLGGRTVNYAEALGRLLDNSAAWPSHPISSDWQTFAGSLARTKVVPVEVEVGAPLWRQPLPKAPSADLGYPPRRVAEDKNELLSYHPLLVGNLVLVNNVHEIRAYRVESGAPAWGTEPVIFRDDDSMGDRPRNARNSLGAPRFTMTVEGNRLYARMGNPVTGSQVEAGSKAPSGYLVCLDLAAEGRLVWDSRKSMPLDESWAFEGSPLSDGGSVYVAMRRGDVRPQSHVACLDAETGALRWRRLVCGAETPAQGQYQETTHNLLTLDRGVLYLNTNLGAVAALSARDGQVQWITLYPRAKAGDLNQRAKHFYRDLTPCVYDRGMLFVAPADSRFILALDAPTGLMLWQTDLPEDVVHLLGVGGGNLLASGDKIWWIQVATGKVAPVEWPEGAWPDGPSPKGYGRGVLAGNRVYWPTRSAVYVFDQQTGRKEQEIELSTRGAAGGNLLVAGGSLLVATSDELLAFSPRSGRLDPALPGESPPDELLPEQPAP